MERDYLEHVCGLDPSLICVGAARTSPHMHVSWSNDAPWIVFFSEPYEADVWRAEAIYRELLPQLCAVARRAGKTVVLKLHPFETVAQRQRVVDAALTEQDRKLVNVIDSPPGRDSSAHVVRRYG